VIERIIKELKEAIASDSLNQTSPRREVRNTLRNKALELLEALEVIKVGEIEWTECCGHVFPAQYEEPDELGYRQQIATPSQVLEGQSGTLYFSKKDPTNG
jgi:hypothetical protein